MLIIPKQVKIYLSNNEKQINRGLFISIFVVLALICVVLFNSKDQSSIKVASINKEVLAVSKKPKKITTPTQIPTSTPSIALSPTSVETTSISSKLLFGMGPEADKALQTQLVKEAPVRILTSWYNGPGDLAWMTQWKNDLVWQSYAKGYTLHLITFTDYPEGQLETKYGPACGREYPVSSQYLDDMRQLAETFKGTGPLYVTLFTEFQTYPCEDNTWVGNENYYNALKDQYRAVKDVFHQIAPTSKVAISWGGWQTRWDDPAKGAGRSLIPYFADIMMESDFTAFQAMESGSNIDDIRNMTKTLGSYKKPVMLSHYLPDSQSKPVYDADTHAIFTDSYLNEVIGYGLFAFSFMGNDVINSNEDSYQFIRNSVEKYAK